MPPVNLKKIQFLFQVQGFPYKLKGQMYFFPINSAIISKIMIIKILLFFSLQEGNESKGSVTIGHGSVGQYSLPLFIKSNLKK